MLLILYKPEEYDFGNELNEVSGDEIMNLTLRDITF